MASHSSTLAWKITWLEEPGRLQFMGSLRVRHNWATSLSLFSFHALEKEMATHSSVLAWRIPGMGEPGGLPSMGSHRVGQDWSNLAAAAVCPTQEPRELVDNISEKLINSPWIPGKQGLFSNMQPHICTKMKEEKIFLPCILFSRDGTLKNISIFRHHVISWVFNSYFVLFFFC